MSACRCGRIAPTPEQRRRAPLLTDFARAPLPLSETPAEVHNADGAAISMGGNDQVGDCTVAGMANYFAICDKAIGVAITIVVAKLLAFYRAMTGGPDTGLVETDVIAKVAADGLDVGDGKVRKIGLWARIPYIDEAVFRFFVWKGLAVYLGGSLSDNDVGASSWTFTHASTDPADQPNVNNGHCFLAAGFGPRASDGSYSIDYVTWGQIVKGDNAWKLSRVDEAYVFVDEEFATAHSFDWDGLVSYVNNVPTS